MRCFRCLRGRDDDRRMRRSAADRRVDSGFRAPSSIAVGPFQSCAAVCGAAMGSGHPEIRHFPVESRLGFLLHDAGLMMIMNFDLVLPCEALLMARSQCAQKHRASQVLQTRRRTKVSPETRSRSEALGRWQQT